MKRCNKATIRMLLTFYLTMALPAAVLAVTCAPPVSDANTVLLDHFSGSTSGQVTGSVTFGAGPSACGQAANFASGSWITYSIPGWYQWTTVSDPTGKSGTVSLWIDPAKYNSTFLTINWNNAATPPSAGYITQLGLDSGGHLTVSGFSSVVNNPFDPSPPPTEATIPLDSWTQVAYTWSPTGGTDLYIDGSVAWSSPADIYPGLNPNDYVYLNPWGSNALSAADELEISSVAQTFSPQAAPEPSSLVLLGAGLLAFAGLCFRRRRWGNTDFRF